LVATAKGAVATYPHVGLLGFCLLQNKRKAAKVPEMQAQKTCL
jgi:hypothetical protein